MTRFVIHGATIVDGTGRAPLRGRTVVVEDGRIADIINEGAVPAVGEARRIDLSGCTLLPGLIDMHVHMGFGGRGVSGEGAIRCRTPARCAGSRWS